MKYIKVLKLSKLNALQKRRLYDALRTKYSVLQCEIIIRRNGNDEWKSRPDVLFKGNDLCVSNFAHNYYFRTNRAIKHEKYATLGHAIGALKKLIRSHGWVISSNLYVYKNGQHLFSIDMGQ